MSRRVWIMLALFAVAFVLIVIEVRAEILDPRPVNEAAVGAEIRYSLVDGKLTGQIVDQELLPYVREIQLGLKYSGFSTAKEIVTSVDPTKWYASSPIDREGFFTIDLTYMKKGSHPLFARFYIGEKIVESRAVQVEW